MPSKEASGFTSALAGSVSSDAPPNTGLAKATRLLRGPELPRAAVRGPIVFALATGETPTTVRVPTVKAAKAHKTL
jgi:hypothetical protein